MSSIGSCRPRAAHILQHFGLAPFRALLSTEEFAVAARQGGCEPRRKRPLIPEVVAWLMMYVGLTNQSMTQGLTQAWGLVRAICPALKDTCVTEEAFCSARGLLSLSFWRTLWNRLQQRYREQFQQSMLWREQASRPGRRWHGGRPAQRTGTREVLRSPQEWQRPQPPSPRATGGPVLRLHRLLRSLPVRQSQVHGAHRLATPHSPAAGR